MANLGVNAIKKQNLVKFGGKCFKNTKYFIHFILNGAKWRIFSILGAKRQIFTIFRANGKFLTQSEVK